MRVWVISYFLSDLSNVIRNLPRIRTSILAAMNLLVWKTLWVNNRLHHFITNISLRPTCKHCDTATLKRKKWRWVIIIQHLTRIIRCLAFCAPTQRRKVLNDINNIEWNDLWTRNTGWYMPPGPFTCVCYLLYARSDHTMHKFGVAVHFPCSTKSSISTQDRNLKNDSFAVRSDCCRFHGCTWWVLYNFRVWNVDLSLRKFCVSLQASLNNATLKHIKRPQNNCGVFPCLGPLEWQAFYPWTV